MVEQFFAIVFKTIIQCNRKKKHHSTNIYIFQFCIEKIQLRKGRNKNEQFINMLLFDIQATKSTRTIEIRRNIVICK